MGHWGNLKDEYRTLVKRLEAGQLAMPEPEEERARAGWQEILEIMFTPEEAELASKLPVMPSDIGRISARVGIPPEQLEPRLEAMCEKGIVMDLVPPGGGKARYLLSPPVVGFFEFSLMRAHDKLPQKRLAAAYDAYMHGDETFAREVFGGGTVIGRTLVHETGIAEDALPDVLDWESAQEVVSGAKSWAVAVCYCRHKAKHLGKACDVPQEICLSLNGGADFVVRRHFGRSIDKAEAMAIMTEARELGLVQIADNVRDRPAYICNCCGCCCAQLGAVSEFDLPAVNPSGFLAHTDLAKCSGCSRCARACPVAAVKMDPQRVEARPKNTLVPVINTDRCLGCGVCADACRKGAMRMVRRPERSYVPRDTMERVLRMAIERGRLAHLLFDEGASRGSRFLNRMVRALNALPGAQRVIASEQVTSRFLRAALRRP